MTPADNVLVPLNGLTLPADLPWRVKFVQLVDDHLRHLHAARPFRPPRFFGYYFKGRDPVAVSGNWTVLLDGDDALLKLCGTLDELTCGQFSITTEHGDEPDFILIHDRHDGACWLWRYAYGLKFVTATDALGEE